MVQFIAKTVVLASLLWGTNANAQGSKNYSVPCEALLAANLSSRVLLPNDPLYEPRVQSYYLSEGRLHPWCFFVPRTTSEIATAIKALSALSTNGTSNDWGIAVRSGGHMYPGSNNIVNGVTIDLGNMNASWYNSNTKLASLQPGGRWAGVYRNLHDKFNVTVTGGRGGDVGVGGFLLGGGISYHTGINGFGCDTVVNYEVVLADGRIVNANESSNPDLYKALKGGGPNFGIVTRFDVEALSAVDMAFGDNYYDIKHAGSVISALSDFTNKTEAGSGDHTFTMYQLGDRPFTVQRMVNARGNLNTTAYEAFQQIPALKKSFGPKSLADATPPDDTGPPGGALSYNFNVKNTPEIIKYVVSRFEQLSSTLVAKGNYTTLIVAQPLPLYYGELSKRHGGDVLGVDRLQSHAMLFVLGVNINTSSNEAIEFATKEVRLLLHDVEALLKQENGEVEWIYMNYADKSQNPLMSYGEENMAFMEKVAKKYDPEGWWQRMMPGGFKLSKARG